MRIRCFLWLGLCTLAVSGPIQIANSQSSTAPQFVRRPLANGPYGIMADRSVLPIAGSPFSADVHEDIQRVLADDTHITMSRDLRIARDSEGRVYEDQKRSQKFNGVEHISEMITIRDPVAHTNITLQPERRMAFRVITNPVMPGPVSAVGAAGNMNSTERPVPPAPARRSAVPGLHDQPEIENSDLGNDMIEGVPVQHVRITEKIAPGAQGNDREIIVVRERWYSPELQVSLMSIINDPRSSNTTRRLSNIQRGEPDPALFQIPAGYTVNEHEIQQAAPTPKIQP